MRIEATDESFIEFEVDSGNPANVTVLIAATDASTESTLPWRTWLYDFDFEIPAARHQLTAHQRKALPGDCLFDFDDQGVVYCFSAPTRKFVSMNPDGSVNWDFPLPGENSSNHIEGISVINNDSLCIIADVTVTIGDSRHEVSCFELSGAFISTQATLEPHPRIGDPVKPRDPLAINLENESLKVVSDGSSFYLAGSYYDMITGADPALQDSWERSAGFVARVEAATGTVLAWHSFPAAQVTQLSIAENRGVMVSVVPNNDRPTTYLLDTETLASTDNVAADSILHEDNLPQLLPDVYKTITGQDIQDIEDQLLFVTDLVASDLYFGEDDFCTSNNMGLGCEFVYGPEILTAACPISGTATISMLGESSIHGPTRSHSTTAAWVFDHCVIESIGAESGIPVHSINGSWRYTTLRYSNTSYEFVTTTSNLVELVLVNTQDSQTLVSGEIQNIDGRISRSSNLYVYRDGFINSFINDEVTVSNTRFGYHIDRTQSNGEWVAIEFYGTEEIDATLSTQATANEPVRIRVPETFGTTGIHAGYHDIIDSNYIFGSMTLAAEDGSAFNFTALESPIGIGLEVFEYQSSGSNATVTGRIPSAGFYFPYTVTGDIQP